MKQFYFGPVEDVTHALNYFTRHLVNLSLYLLGEAVRNPSKSLVVCILQAFPSPFNLELRYFVLVPDQGLRLSIADE